MKDAKDLKGNNKESKDIKDFVKGTKDNQSVVKDNFEQSVKDGKHFEMGGVKMIKS